MDERILDRLLGPLERAVMEVVWDQPVVTVRDVHDALARRRRIAYTTVLTVMTRLTEKAVLERELRSGHHVYRARLSPEELVEAASRREVDRILADFGDLAITHFLQSASPVDPDLKERLRRMASGERPQTSRKSRKERR